MLYDPKWEQQTEQKADPFKIETLIAWLEMQPANRVYCYTDIANCLFAQYFTAMMGRPCIAGSDEIYFLEPDGGVRDETHQLYPKGWTDSIAFEGDRTFGAALERARSLSRSHD